MSIIQLLQILLAQRLVILVSLFSCLLGAVVVALYLLPPRYEARARVMLVAMAADPITGETMSDNFMEAYVSTQAALITDYQTMGAVVDKIGWANNPIIVQQYAEATNGTGRDVQHWLADGLSSSTGVRLIPGSNVLEIIHTSTTPEGAKGLVELIRATYIERSLEMRRLDAGRLADWFRLQGDETLAELRKAERFQAEFARANDIIFQPSLSDLESTKLASLAERSAAATAASARGRGGRPSSPVQIQLDSVNQQIAQAATTLGPNHPAYQALLRQRQVLMTESARHTDGASLPSSTVDPAKIAAQMERQKGRVVAQHEGLERLKLMQQEIELKQGQYLKAMQRAADLRLQANVTDADLTPFGETIAPTSPSFPNLPLVLVGSIGLGTVLGIIAALLIEFLSLRVRCGDDLEFATGVPLIATVAHHGGVAGWLARFWRHGSHAPNQFISESGE